ncbi:hypothetical protein TNCV_5006071, partial [Trichonephila clavipes]
DHKLPWYLNIDMFFASPSDNSVVYRKPLSSDLCHNLRAASCSMAQDDPT